MPPNSLESLSKSFQRITIILGVIECEVVMLQGRNRAKRKEFRKGKGIIHNNKSFTFDFDYIHLKKVHSLAGL